MRLPTPQLNLMIVAAMFPPAICGAASLLIDDFSDGPFSLIGQYGASLDDKDTQVGTMLGRNRYTALTSSSRQFGVTAVLVTGGSELSFNANIGPPGLLGNQGVFYAIYGVPLVARDFTSYSGFMLSIPSVSGAGIVEVGLGSALFSVPIDHAGSVFVPIEGSGISPSSLSSVIQIRLQFTAVSSDFSVSVDRFSAVPEPTTFMLISAGMGLCFRRNRRSEQGVAHQRAISSSITFQPPSQPRPWADI
jgi:hypothetical protein